MSVAVCRYNRCTLHAGSYAYSPYSDRSSGKTEHSRPIPRPIDELYPSFLVRSPMGNCAFCNGKFRLNYLQVGVATGMRIE